MSVPRVIGDERAAVIGRERAVVIGHPAVAAAAA